MPAHDPAPQDLEFRQTAHEERHLLETVQVPIVTVSATFREELEEKFGEKPSEVTEDVTFSRAHYSMANALVVAATKRHKSFWMVDPTNYVSAKDWPKIMFTERMGRLIARSPILKELKDMVDTRLRNQLPLTKAIRKPLSYVFHRVTRPVISFHYEAGNILVENHKRVLQVVTDPHVRPQYVTHASNPLISWAVFDERTKAELIHLAYMHGTPVDPSRVIITGAPVDPRISRKDRNRTTRAFKHRPLRLAVTTGGLGTNKAEIKQFLHEVSPLLKAGKLHLALFAGVHEDFREMFEHFAEGTGVKIGKPEDDSARLRVFCDDDIIEINELLLDHIFPWADGFVTKPSGDMAYEAVAAGCFLLTLEPWGEWEVNIRQFFEERGVSVRAHLGTVSAQLNALTHAPVEKNKPWIQLALERALRMQAPLSRGAFNILTLHQKLA